MNTPSVTLRAPLTHSPQPPTWEPPTDTYTLTGAKEQFTQQMNKDVTSGDMGIEAEKMANAVLRPDPHNKVQVKTFAIDGVQAKDIIFIQRVPAIDNKTNILLYVPEDAGRSFQSFNSTEDMNTWLKATASNPDQLETFISHFAGSDAPAKRARVTLVMNRFKDNDINAVVRPYADEGSDIFELLNKGPTAPPSTVNGLTNIIEANQSPDGRIRYSGQRPDGEKILFEYDAYGNLLGADKRKNFYFVKNGLNNHKPLVPMSFSEFRSVVTNQAADNVGANDIRGLYEQLLTQLEHPFSGLGDALEAFGINHNTADTVERYFDNPFSALLIDLNKNNHIGKVFGLDKATMDSDLHSAGSIAQGFVPFYGQARGLGTLLAKALRNEPLSDDEKRDMAEGMALRPNSPARKNLLQPKMSQPGHEKYNPQKPGPNTQPANTEPAPNEVAKAPAEPNQPEKEVNRTRPSQWRAISQYAVDGGEQLIAGVTSNAKGIYQVKGPYGGDRWFIRMGSDGSTRQVYEIDGKFKLSDGYVNIIDPATQKTVMTVHSTGDGTWEPINGPGGIKWPWQTNTSAHQEFDPAAYDHPPEGEASSSKVKEKIDKQLKRDADAYHKSAKAKPRPVLSDLPQNASEADVINAVYKKSTGMVVGEDHSESSGLRFLIDHASEFKNNKVTTLYSEGFEHSLQPDLDRFYETGEFSPALRKNLKLIDLAHRQHGDYSNRHLLLKMREYGIRVKAIDVPSIEPITTRLKNMNYYASKVIENDQKIAPGEKWVARVGSAHVSKFDGSPPILGISELTGATGVTVDEALPNQASKVIQSRDKTEIYLDLKEGT